MRHQLIFFKDCFQLFGLQTMVNLSIEGNQWHTNLEVHTYPPKHSVQIKVSYISSHLDNVYNIVYIYFVLQCHCQSSMFILLKVGIIMLYIVASYDFSHYTTINLQVRMLAVKRKTPQYLQTCRKKWLWSSRKK